MTKGQFGQLAPALEAEGGSLVKQLRSTLQTIVIDEIDDVLSPEGKGYMLNRSRRTRALKQVVLLPLPPPPRGGSPTCLPLHHDFFLTHACDADARRACVAYPCCSAKARRCCKARTG